MSQSILVPINDSVSSRVMIDFIVELPVEKESFRITLLHVFRSPQAGEELMGKRFMTQQPSVLKAVLEKARDKLVEKGFDPGLIEIKLVEDPYPTVAEGIIDQFNKGGYNMIVIGRKAMSKAEEFVRGDVCVKLVRMLRGTAVLVVTTP